MASKEMNAFSTHVRTTYTQAQHYADNVTGRNKVLGQSYVALQARMRGREHNSKFDHSISNKSGKTRACCFAEVGRVSHGEYKEQHSRIVRRRDECRFFIKEICRSSCYCGSWVQGGSIFRKCYSRKFRETKKYKHRLMY